MKLLKVSDSKRFLVDSDGEPFFYLGDTAWELFHSLSREEAELYLSNRASCGFNVIQAVLLAEMDGLDVPNYYGQRPLRRNGYEEYDPCLPDVAEDRYDYWDHVDYIVGRAEELGLYMGLLPTWGDKFNRKWGTGPVIFTPQNAYAYGKWLGQRYVKYSNIIWILGGDRPLETMYHHEVVDQMAAGLGDGGGHKFLMTYHPCGGESSSRFVHDRKWLDFNMMQSGHGERNTQSWKMIFQDRERFPIKPVLDGEPCYEDHPIGFRPEEGYFDAFDVRNRLYWNALSGACGNVYGHHSIWSMNRNNESWPPEYVIMPWTAALERPGAQDVKVFSALQQTHPVLKCTPCPNVVADNREGANFIAGCGCRQYALFYIPNGLRFRLHMDRLFRYSEAHWFDVRSGAHLPVSAPSLEGEFVPPSSGRNHDWLLILSLDS